MFKKATFLVYLLALLSLLFSHQNIVLMRSGENAKCCMNLISSNFSRKIGDKSGEFAEYLGETHLVDKYSRVFIIYNCFSLEKFTWN